MEGWRREMFADETGLPWVMPSPNMPTLDTAVVYPGTVLFEGTLLSEGRGTTRPFELVGAPGIEAERFAQRDERAGPARRRSSGRPSSSRRSRSTRSSACGGCQMHVTDRRAFKPVLDRRGAHRRCSIARRPAQPLWRQPPYEYEHEKLPIDILAGSPQFREQIEAGASAAAMAESWRADERAFKELRAPYLLY